jgi:hypothetical protein
MSPNALEQLAQDLARVLRQEFPGESDREMATLCRRVSVIFESRAPTVSRHSGRPSLRPPRPCEPRPSRLAP